MQLRIKEVHEKNNLWNQLVTQNVSLVEGNKKLNASKEELEWETNPEIKTVDATKQKEEGKCHTLEEEVAELRKKNNQLGTKVEEYATEYPDFKIDKKLKKAEPAPQPLPAKTQAPVADSKSNNTKKKNKSNEQIPVQVVEE